jgi:pSer/pThr/pTyr-binding forkhead associated (FHA) protein
MTTPKIDGDTGARVTALSDGRSYAIPTTGLLIGRDSKCDVVLGSLRVSRRHARVMAAGAGYSLIDESTNGVVVNGTRIDRTTVLCQGDIIGIGEEAFRFTADNRASEPQSFAGEPLPAKNVVPAPTLATVPTETIPRSKRY